MGEQTGETKRPRWPLGLQGDVEDAVMAWLDKDDLANADGSMFDAIVAALGLEYVGELEPMPDTLGIGLLGMAFDGRPPAHSMAARMRAEHPRQQLYRLAAQFGSSQQAPR